jgi:hypothetical protein
MNTSPDYAALLKLVGAQAAFTKLLADEDRMLREFDDNVRDIDRRLAKIEAQRAAEAVARERRL